MIDLYTYSKKPTRNTIAYYPTILDVLETIAIQENVAQRGHSPYPIPNFPLHLINHKGKSIVMFDPNIDGGLELYPASQRMSIFYRGQSQYFSRCKPSVLRLPVKEQKTALLLYRLQVTEFNHLLSTHPVIKAIQTTRAQIENAKISIPVNPYTLAQHYGISTPFLDLTADKWTAAFFATTDYREGKYYVHHPSKRYQSQYGVFYIIDTQSLENLSAASIYSVGLNYFNRPGCQSALVMDLTKIKDFHKSPYVKPIFFRHDDKCNELVYIIHNHGSFLFPDDSLGDIAEKMQNAKKKTFSKQTVEDVRKSFYLEIPECEFNKKILANGWKIEDNLTIQFNSDNVRKEQKIWDSGDNLRFLEKLIYFPLYAYKNFKFD